MTPKDIRKQLRNVVQEEMENVMLAEIRAAVSKDVMTEVMKRLSALEDLIREKLTIIDERSKDTMSYLVRQSTQPASIKE